MFSWNIPLPSHLKKKLSVFIFKGGISPIMHFSQLSFAEKAFVSPPFSGDICTRSEIPGSETFLTSTWRRRPIVSALPRCQRAVCRRPCLRSSLCDVSAPRPAPRPWLLSGMFSFSFIFCMLNMICLAMCLGGYLLCLVFSGFLGSAI